jgi:hypothetical protein
MKTYSVYLSYTTCSKQIAKYTLRSISFKDIVATSIVDACNIAIQRASLIIKNNVMPLEISMAWYNV